VYSPGSGTIRRRESLMTFDNLLPLLEDIQTVLHAKGCKVTNVSVTLCTAEQETTIDVGALETDARDDAVITPERG
jgi:hypothetical protein